MTLCIAADIAPADITVTKYGYDLHLNIAGTPDRLTLRNWLNGTNYRVEEVRFADGTVWNGATLETLAAQAGIVGTAGNDGLIGTSGDDSIQGAGGNDTVYGYGGRDMLDGGSGNDTLYAASSAGGLDSGEDVYLFGRGSGRDAVYDYDTTAGNTDVIRLAADVLPSEVVVWRGTNDLYLSIGAVTGSEDRIAIANWFTNTANRIERIEFADGTVWGTALLTTAPILGTTGNDTLYGTVGDDLFDGEAGNDTLYGYTSGGYDSGDDVYLFGRGSGRDTVYDYDTTAGNTDVIRLAADVLPSEVVVWRGTNDLYLSIGAVTGSEDRIAIANWFTNIANRIERIEFSDGTVWGEEKLALAPMLGTTGNDYLYGTVADDFIDGGGGNDTAYGYGGRDVLDGGSGNDTLFAASFAGGLDSGDDVYLFGKGSGRDTVYDYDTTAGNTDVIRLAADVLPSEVVVWRGTNDLYLSIGAVGSEDRIAIANWFTNIANRIERIEFADGTVWGTAVLGSAPILGTANAETLYGTAGDDLFDGGAGNDTLYGYTNSYGTGNDTYLLKRGNGQDTILDYDTAAGNLDTIRAAGLLPSEVTLGRDTYSLILKINGGTDQMTVNNWFANTANRVERVVFDDGTVWDSTTLAGAPILGTANAETLYGTTGDDLFDGGAGNDTLYGYTSSYGTGNDTYLLKRGNGQDTVIDYDATVGNLDTIRAVGLLPSEVTLGRETNSLILKVNGATDQLTVSNWFGSTASRVERVVFDDGTVWDTALLASAPILGTTGNDTLYGTVGDDLFDGGAGNDTLYGNNTSAGMGNDTYLLKRGNGQDTIVDYNTVAGNLDTIRAVGLLPSEVTLGRDTYSLILKINGGTDQMTVNNWFGSTASRVERVVFDDGTVWDTVLLASAPILGTTGNDTLYGTVGDDLFDGGAGNDTLYGYTSSYGTGNDTYLLKRGNGQDTVIDYDATVGNLDTIRAVGLLPSEVTLGRETNSLILKVNGATDQLTVSNWFANTANRVERVVFDDGTVWDAALLATAPILGTANADTLYGTVGDDLFDGGAGNDTLYGYTSSYGTGNDTYLLKRGNGQDTVIDYDATVGNLDTIRAVGLLPSEVTLGRETNSLILKVNGATDQLTMSNWFGSTASRVERVVFDDGTVWDMALLGSAAIMGTALANTLSGSADADLIQGLGGNDTLSGNAGNDIMQGGADNDTISDTSGNNLFDGGAGIDTLTGGSGRELFIGGAGNDTVTTGLGADIILFNRGDGQDIFTSSTGPDNTLSLGGGIRYTDLSFSKSANDLVLGLGNAEQIKITLKDWYATGANNKSVVNLQMVAEAMADFDSTSSDPLRNNKVEAFNFGGLADRFDQARAADPTLTNWSLTNALLDFHLSGSDTDALGGDLAYQYGKTGTLAGLGVTAVQSVLSHAQFATTPQTLQPLATLQEGIVKLG